MNIEIALYKHFSFDLWLTLIRSNPKFKAKRNLLLKDYFSVNHSIEKVNEVVRYYDVLCNQTNEITGSNIDTNEMYLLMLGALSIDLENISTAVLDDFYAETEQLFFKYKPELLVTDVHKTFDSIKAQNKTISILSNTALIKGKTLRQILNHYELGKYFSFQLYSDELGISKPNVEIFKTMIRQAQECNNLPLENHEIVHIGDNPIADIKGADAAGVQSILVKY